MATRSIMMKAVPTEAMQLSASGFCSPAPRARPASLQVLISHLTTGFHALGFTAAWPSPTGRPNPADSLAIRQYLKLVGHKAHLTSVAPLQAVAIGQADIETLLNTLHQLISLAYTTRS
ncbi:hypothetical protein HDU77_010462 [Chytriomyces hyalinus]|nr:hypothetical protein HDU77_010462 [Chytriomyces hyalinus]